MKTLRRLAIAADIVAFAVVLLGSWTRINAAGMTCPDWPTCRGTLVPSMSGGTVWEWTHRLLAMLLAPLIVAVCVAAWRHRGRSALLAAAGVAITALFLIQVALGAATVKLDNSPFSVVLHWGTAMAVVAALTALAIVAEDEGRRASTRVTSSVPTTMLATACGVAFFTMCLGAYVSSSGAGLACLTIPGCAGNVVVYTPGQVVQMLHRLAAAATVLSAVGACAIVWTRPVALRARLCASAGLFLVFIQVILGLLNVALRLPTNLREMHAANAALVFLAFVAATAFSLMDAPATVPAQERR